MEEELDYKSNVYKERFIRWFTTKGVDHEIALDEFNAWVEVYADESPGNPEGDAEEAMSYWSE